MSWRPSPPWRLFLVLFLVVVMPLKVGVSDLPRRPHPNLLSSCCAFPFCHTAEGGRGRVFLGQNGSLDGSSSLSEWKEGRLRGRGAAETSCVWTVFGPACLKQIVASVGGQVEMLWSMSLDFEASNFCSPLFTVNFFFFASFFFFMYSLLVGRVGVGNVSPELEVVAFPPPPRRRR